MVQTVIRAINVVAVLGSLGLLELIEVIRASGLLSGGELIFRSRQSQVGAFPVRAESFQSPIVQWRAL